MPLLEWLLPSPLDLHANQCTGETWHQPTYPAAELAGHTSDQFHPENTYSLWLLGYLTLWVLLLLHYCFSAFSNDSPLLLHFLSTCWFYSILALMLHVSEIWEFKYQSNVVGSGISLSSWSLFQSPDACVQLPTESPPHSIRNTVIPFQLLLRIPPTSDEGSSILPGFLASQWAHPSLLSFPYSQIDLSANPEGFYSKILRS